MWTVTCNAENRPIRWQSGDTVITMAFDRSGHRVWMRESEGDTATKEDRFVCDGYLCVQRLDAMQGNAVRTEFVWDPTEPVATRSLAMRARNWGLNLFYSHDGNKNVSKVFYHAPQNGIAAHYDYAPFGAVTRTTSATRVTNRDLLSENPFRFSSEYHDDPLALVYSNYRHYTSHIGRWLGRDFVEYPREYDVYFFAQNDSINKKDRLGLTTSLYTIVGDMLCDMVYEKARQYLTTAQEQRAWDRYTHKDGIHARDNNIYLTSEEVRFIAESNSNVLEYRDAEAARCSNGCNSDEKK